MNLFSKSLLSILCLLFIGKLGYAQTDACVLPYDQLPEVRGFRLGMTIEQIKQRYPHFPELKTNAYGYSEFTEDFMVERGRYESLGSTRVEPLSGINKESLGAVELAFLDNKLVVFKISYNNKVEWQSVDNFVESLATSLKLPPAAKWSKTNNLTMRLACKDYSLRATISSVREGRGSIGFYTPGISQEIEKRERDAKERQRREFKP